MTKHGRSYTTFDVIIEQGKLINCTILEGLWAADAQSQLDVFCKILGKVSGCLQNKDEVISKTFINTKKLMSDCSSTPKKKLVNCLWSSEETF